jgi:hypothetical protein
LVLKESLYLTYEVGPGSLSNSIAPMSTLAARIGWSVRQKQYPKTLLPVADKKGSGNIPQDRQ